MSTEMAIPIPSRQLFIDGESREPVLRKRIPVINPATEETAGDIPAATVEDVEIAVDAARRAFFRNKGKDWATASGAFRAKFLRAIAAKILERKSELAKLETIDTGKPLDESVSDMDGVADCFKYYAELAESLDAKQSAAVSLPTDSFKCHVLKEPIGVVALITPWNYPLLMAAWKVAPALAAGCTAILKPSELASVTCLELAEVCKEIALPPGVLNILSGIGSEAGAPLASHPHVDKIAFTGSTATGIKVMTAAAQMIKPVSLELGGKSPMLVFEDADLDRAAEWAIFGCFLTNGQICSATSRLLVHESVAARFLEKLIDWTKSIKISDPMEEGCRLGPIVSEGQYEKVMNYISTAKEEGATVLYGGVCPQHLKKGFFVEPTIITDVSTSMQIWREEVFGPVLCIKVFTSEEEGIELANDTCYGLGAAVISKDLERCNRLTTALQAGVVWVNCSQPCFNQAPWGGNKRSGIGRELGEWGLENYLSIKQVTEYICSDKPYGWFASPPKQGFRVFQMASLEEKVVAVIMVGGPTKGTRFRPLSFNTPKPLFPLAGQPMVHHPILACKRIPNLSQILLIGFYEEREFALYVSSISNELKVPIRYLREDKPHGSAGGLYYFRDLIMEDAPSHIFLLNCDVCCNFPLPDMLEAHRRYDGMGTLLVTKVSAESANQFGELVADPITNELLHYTEKPETFVSDLINCGIYVFTPEIFTAIQDVSTHREGRANLRRVSSFEALQLATRTLPTDFFRLDQDILSPLTGKKRLYTYETMDFWEQIKTPGISLKCSALYLVQFRLTSPHLLASGDGTKSATVIGDVYVHPSAKVHPTAKIGPSVSISANVRIAAGVRLISCIILDDVEIKENAVVMHAIVGWKSSLGKWSRVQAEGDYNAKLGITILGEAVTVEDEVVVTNSIVLPNKSLNGSVQEEIIL
ncbi:hypothetical protein F0562_004696 [Nyssa sinensis]|uniref:Nucleotidyl transferase domain-containing protein n=1 Tax=Nyssa sinensis TaxID=561372 RepID=A0A5J5BXX7_9ASTE|nr:hypothetical protein F0562_004696 [Nyssa sinensis]